MYLRVSVPGKFQLKLIPTLQNLLFLNSNEIHYIGGTEVLPAPLEREAENDCIMSLGTENEEDARKKLIEHNLRLVVYIAKKFDNTGIGVEDLISIGTIGLIKSINTYNPDKNIKLATYASRCIENEILMYLRRTGNELLLSDILGTEEDIIYKDMETEMEKKLLKAAIARLSSRERNIIELRYGLTAGGKEYTQKEVADQMGISQSYISRLEKKIMRHLKKEITKYE